MPWDSCPLDVQSRGLAWPLPHHLVCVERIRFPSVALRLVLYNCTSGYPVPFEDVCLLELRELYDKYHARVKAIGFSGHHLGIAVDVAAYAMGAQWNERHFTKDRTWKGTDHAASLEPAGLTKLCRDLQATWKCMTPKASEILPIEKEQRAKLKWGCYNAAEVKK